MNIRLEKDFLGEMKISDDIYYGIQTARAINNFSATKYKLNDFPLLIKSLALIKLACAKANFRAGNLDEKKYDAIEYACNCIVEGKFNNYFLIDMIQGGAGTSTNMNINEVVANIGLEYLGYRKGEYSYLHPNNDVNMSQSTNDVYPTALRLAVLLSVQQYEKSASQLIHALKEKAINFKNIIKMGRTQLQDAVPMSLGQEFQAFADSLEKDMKLYLSTVYEHIPYINLGGTAIGTGINTTQSYRQHVIEELNTLTDFSFHSAPNLIEATSDTSDFVLLSGILKRTSLKLSKICNDLRLLSSGPRTGICEINLPAKQPGSSIMPGKVNPVIPEYVNQICFQVIGNDLTIAFASEAGQLQLNVMEPLIIFKLFENINLLMVAFDSLTNDCIKGITANKERCSELLYKSAGIVTALNPLLGYEKTCQIAKLSQVREESIFKILTDENILTNEQIASVFDMENLIFPQGTNVCN
ncbi:aspartate ammonia-lyase [Acinetobacter pseudolwoffii]|uniref:aspartate ammonia-lyase n=1 Tax=Acinetobacter pseudolwoffii TaxID=2053287 RepID=UPI0024688F98|nr:aspartate ammonia-lyase [Acinetobacter pseudolwoffii]MDH5821164.1 aspartate ammonia-lyase [Acinetobacter pseudolwoffii]